MEASNLPANERAQRAYEKEFDAYYEFNFIDGYLELRSENSRLNEILSQARSDLHYFQKRVKEQEQTARMWRRKYRKIVGNEFVDRPSSV